MSVDGDPPGGLDGWRMGRGRGARIGRVESVFFASGDRNMIILCWDGWWDLRPSRMGALRKIWTRTPEKDPPWVRSERCTDP